MMTWFEFAAYSSLLGYLLALTGKLALACRYARIERSRVLDRDLLRSSAMGTSEDKTVYSITLLQPILSGDPRLSQTLETNLRSLPSGISFLWLVDENDQRGLRETEVLQRKYSNVQIAVCPPSPPMLNPKSFKLQIGLERVVTEYLGVVDDDTMVQRDSIDAAIRSLQEFDLYTGLPIYVPGRNIFEKLVSHFVNNNSVLTYLPPLNFWTPLSINGMYYVLRAQRLRDIGGFAKIQHELCDDYAMKRLATAAGWKIQQGTTVQKVATSISSAGEYFRLLHRWLVFALMSVREQHWIAQLFLAFSLGMPSMFFLCATLLLWVSPLFLLAWLIMVGLRQIILWIANRAVFSETIPMSIFHSLLAELLQPLQTCVALCIPIIRWRGRKIRVTKDRWIEFTADTAR